MLLKSKKPSASPLISYLCTMLYIAVVLFFCLWFFLRYNLYLIIAIALICLLFIFSKIFSWYATAKLELVHGKVVYTVYEILDFLGRQESKYEIKSVKSIKKRGKSTYIIKGEIKYTPQFGNPKFISSCKLLDINKDAEDFLISNLKED